MAGNNPALMTDPERRKRSVVNKALHALASDPLTTIAKQAERLGVTRGALYGWILNYEGDKYKEIINALPDLMAGESLDIADGVITEKVTLDDGRTVSQPMQPARARNAINARQFIMERRFPNKYGKLDRVEITTNDITDRLSAGRKRMTGVIEAEVVSDDE